ncbi:MAG TPA: toll/interleukin-1 receptor domain-containing protein [Chitinophagales bacterium]|nr:toll/interleukin-1 receptor domain-containing protein [Chitinophagales bacterium]
MPKRSGKEIFVSHSVKDVIIVNAFVDLILHGGLNISVENIFCVSTEGSKIKSGEDWRNAIKDSIESAKINFLIITPHYKESEVCMNEMGAAWLSNAKVLPLIVDPITYKTVGVIPEPKQIEKLLDESSLDHIKDELDELGLITTKVNSARWTLKKKEFLSKCKEHLGDNPFPKAMDRITFEGYLKKNEDLDAAIEELIKENKNLKELNQELSKAKDKKEVAEIIRKRNPSSQFEEFRELCKVVSKKLNGYAAIVRGVIFKDYSGKNVDVNWHLYKDELDKAYAADIITEDMEANWRTTQGMRELYQALRNVSLFLDKESLKTEFYESYEEKYSAPLEIRNIEFWNEVFNTTIII